MTDTSNAHQLGFSRRSLLVMTASALPLAALPSFAQSDDNDIKQVKSSLFGDRKIQDGRVEVKLPPIAENGNSVALDISVDSPMTESDHVKQIVVLSPLNPEALVSRYTLTPANGKAAISARIRLAGSQTIEVIAEMSDGTLWRGKKPTLVTLAACVIG